MEISIIALSGRQHEGKFRILIFQTLHADAASVKLQNASLKLPVKQREVFNMKYFDDMSYEEMSGVTGTSVGALKASYHHAVKKIEQFLQDD